jgi:tRNA U34 5-carboxymethylaminomethyl modifying GTPase MnmE/TrmE
MQAPSLTDTIVAVSSAWSPAAVGIVRLSGLQAYACAASLGAAPPHTPGRPVFDERRLRIDESLELPATVYWLPAGPAQIVRAAAGGRSAPRPAR